MEVDAEAAIDDFSDISDNSDIFHVEALPSDVPRTPEDEELQRIAEVKGYLRNFPLLAPDPADASRSTRTLPEARLPTLHCAFAGCTWEHDVQMQRHWDMERCLFNHLKDKHRHKEMRSVSERCSEDIHEAEMILFMAHSTSWASWRPWPLRFPNPHAGARIGLSVWWIVAIFQLRSRLLPLEPGPSV
eukprot:7236643-Heterocapsa_arctica.AAC.1